MCLYRFVYRRKMYVYKLTEQRGFFMVYDPILQNLGIGLCIGCAILLLASVTHILWRVNKSRQPNRRATVKAVRRRQRDRYIYE